MIFIKFILGVAVQGIATSEAKKAYDGQIKWANMLRPDYCKKGRDLAGVPFPVFFIREAGGVTKDEILHEAKALGVKVSYPTLNRWVSKGMVSRPVTESRGRKEGRVSQYKTHALFEVFAAWDLLNNEQKLSIELIRTARESGSFEYPFLLWYVSIFRAYLFYCLHETAKPCVFRIDATISDDNIIKFIEMDKDPDASLKIEIDKITSTSTAANRALAVIPDIVNTIAKTKSVKNEMVAERMRQLDPDVCKVVLDFFKLALVFHPEKGQEDHNVGNVKYCHISHVKQDYIITLCGDIVHFHKRDEKREWVCIKKARAAEILNME